MPLPWWCRKTPAKAADSTVLSSPPVVPVYYVYFIHNILWCQYIMYTIYLTVYLVILIRQNSYCWLTVVNC